MAKKQAKFSYDPDADALRWEISLSGQINYAKELGNVIVHFTKDNVPVLLEILNAKKLIGVFAKLREGIKVPGKELSGL